MSCTFNYYFTEGSGNIYINYNTTEFKNYTVTNTDYKCVDIIPNANGAFNIDIISTAYCTSGSDIGKYKIKKTSTAILYNSSGTTKNTYVTSFYPPNADPTELQVGHTLDLSGNTLSLNFLTDPNVGNTVTYNCSVTVY